MMHEFFRITMHGFVAQVTLDRPPVNAMSRAVMTELQDVVGWLDRQQEARAVVLTGGDALFSAGVDIRELRAAPPQDAIPRNARYQAIYLALDRCRLPVIAAVNGYALGGGCELAMACDIRVAAGDASFGLPEIALGGLPGIGGMQRLQRLVGQGKAKQLILTGDRVDATEAHRIGLVDELVPPGAAVERALELAGRIAARPPLSVQAGKKALDLGRDVPLEHGQVIDLRFCGEIAGTEDRAESLLAFLEKREPRLVGR
jgi:enoyl-CoA hydratase/carnithine racemase